MRSRQHREQNLPLLWPRAQTRRVLRRSSETDCVRSGGLPGQVWVRFTQLLKAVAGNLHQPAVQPREPAARRRLSSSAGASSVCGFPLGPVSGLLYLSLAWVNRSRPERR